MGKMVTDPKYSSDWARIHQQCKQIMQNFIETNENSNKEEAKKLNKSKSYRCLIKLTKKENILHIYPQGNI